MERAARWRLSCTRCHRIHTAGQSQRVTLCGFAAMHAAAAGIVSSAQVAGSSTNMRAKIHITEGQQKLSTICVCDITATGPQPGA